MENAELEVALEELELRLERLRALYEQYFMGIERIEPAIPRKDIDRRIYVLRREKIRNTAKRFKLQTIISRYNTFQQYWQRICREIENGTYKRHVIRAERIAPGQLLTIAARKRLGRAALEAMEPDAAAPEASPPSPPASELPAAGSPAPTQRLTPPLKPIPPPKPGARPLPSAAPVEASAPRTPPPRPAFESLDLDMDFLGDWDPGANQGKGFKRMPEVPARPFGKPLSQPMVTPPTPGKPAPQRTAPAKPAPVPAAIPRHPPPPPKAIAVPAPPTATKPLAAPPAPPMARPTVSKPLAAHPAPPPAAARPLAPIIPGTTAANPPRKPSAAATAPAAVTDERVRELHAQLVEAKRQTQDGAAVSVEGLAKSLKATEAKLREQHKNRKIDFDVVIKDGKAVLKPIVR